MKTLAELSINTYVTEQIQDTSVYTNRYMLLKKKSWVLSFLLGKISAQISAYIFGGIYKNMLNKSTNHFKCQYLNFDSEFIHFPRWHFPLYHLDAALHVNLCLRILQRYSSASPSLWSQQDETGFHSIFCLPLCHASLCRVEAERAAPRSSSTRAQPPELLSAHKLSERGGKRTAWIHAAPVFSQSSVPKRQGTFIRPRPR